MLQTIPDVKFGAWLQRRRESQLGSIPPGKFVYVVEAFYADEHSLVGICSSFHKAIEIRDAREALGYIEDLSISGVELDKAINGD